MSGERILVCDDDPQIRRALTLILDDAGYELLDHFFTPRCVELGEETAQKIARLPRKIGFAIHQDLTVRLLGGYGLLVLAK